MRSACLLRRSWSQLHTVSRGIVGSSCAPLSRRTPQIFIFTLGERFFSGSSDNSSVYPFQGYGKSVSAFVPAWRNGYWSAYRYVSHSEGSFKFPPSGFCRARENCRLLSVEDDSAWPPVTSVYRDSQCWEELHAMEDEGEEPFVGEMEDKDHVKFRGSAYSRFTNDCASLQRLVEVRRPERGDVVSTDLARRVFPGSRIGNAIIAPSHYRSYSSVGASPTKPDGNVDTDQTPTKVFDYSQRAVVTALACNFLVFSLKLGVWIITSSHVMMAEAIHSLADLANQGLIAYGLMSSRRAPDALHPYGYTKERFVWSLISAVGIFCLGSGATIIHGVQNLWSAEPLENIYLAAAVLVGSMIMEGASLLVAISCVRNGARAEGMTVKDYLWRGHDPTSVAVMMEDGAAVTGLAVAGLALTAAHYTGNPMWDPIGSIVVGNLLGAVAIFLIQRNRHALLGRSMDEEDVMRVLNLLSNDPVVDAIYDCKSEVIGPGAYRFKAEIDFNGVTIVQKYIQRAGRGTWHKEFQDAVSSPEPGHLDRVMAAYGEEVVSALGSEVDRLEREIQKVVPGIRHVDIEAHNPNGVIPQEKLYLPFISQNNLISN